MKEASQGGIAATRRRPRPAARARDAQWSGQTGAMQARKVFFAIVPPTPFLAIKKSHTMAGLAL